MPASKPTQQNVRERLFRTALEAFAEHGYAEVSVDEIVKKARTTKPMLYYYFGNKAGLYQAIAEESFALLRRGYERAEDPQTPALERLRAFVRANFAAMREHPHLAQFIYRAAYSPPREAPAIDPWRLFMPSFQLVGQILEAAQNDGLVRPGPAPLLALPLFGMISMWTQVHMGGESQAQGSMLAEDQVEQVVQLYLNGVGAR